MSSPDAPDIGALAGGGQPGTRQLPIEHLIEQLVAHAAEVAAAQARLRRFQAASRLVMGELSLSRLQQRVVEVAREVVGAGYAALAVLGDDGVEVEVLHSGGPEPSEGRAAVAALLAAGDLRTASPPPAAGVLRVPVPSRDRVHAVLYLADRHGGRPFSREDADLAEALAATAGIAVDNALVYEDSRRRQEWLRAAATLSQHLLGGLDDGPAVVTHTLEVAGALLVADTMALLTPDPAGRTLEVRAAWGTGRDRLPGARLPLRTSLAGRAMRVGSPLHVDLAEPGRADGVAEAALGRLVPVGHLLVLPLVSEAEASGAVLAVRRPGRAPFSQAELEMASTFAGQAALAIFLAGARSDSQRLSGMEQRDQIARDLNEQVVQRLFAIGMSLQGTADRVHEPRARARLLRAVEDVDETIRQIRSSIFTRTSLGDGATRTVAETARRVVPELAPVLGTEPELELEGPLEWPATAPLIRDVEAVLRESLTNAAKYARASRVVVRVATDGTRLEIAVTDNGIGLQGSTRRSGLDNLRRRAERYGGQLSIDNQPEGGLRLLWAIPL